MNKHNVEIDWKVVGEDTWKPTEKDEQLQGVIVNKVKTDVGQYYLVETKDGIKKVYGTTILDTLLCEMEIGDLVRITFKGTKAHKNPAFSAIQLWRVEKGEKRLK